MIDDKSSEVQKIEYLVSFKRKLDKPSSVVQMIYRKEVYAMQMSKTQRYDVLYCLVVETHHEVKSGV